MKKLQVASSAHKSKPLLNLKINLTIPCLSIQSNNKINQLAAPVPLPLCHKGSWRTWDTQPLLWNDMVQTRPKFLAINYHIFDWSTTLIPMQSGQTYILDFWPIYKCVQNPKSVSYSGYPKYRGPIYGRFTVFP